MKKGFTLIELMVSVTIFSIVMMVALGSLLAISSAERKAETLKTAIDNLSFAMEGMSRAIRTGSDYHCGVNGTGPQNCGNPLDPVYTSGQPYLTFTANDGNKVAYCLDAGSVKRQITSGTPSTDCTSGVFLPMTAPEIVISDLTFYVNGALRGAADNRQPRVTITLAGAVNLGTGIPTPFSLQSALTQRIYDL